MRIILKDGADTYEAHIPDGLTLAVGDVITARGVRVGFVEEVHSVEVVRRHWQYAEDEKMRCLFVSHYDVRGRAG